MALEFLTAATGIASTLFGDDDSTVTIDSTQDTTTTTTGTRAGTRATTGTATGTESSVTELLSSDVQDALKDVILSLTGGQLAGDDIGSKIKDISTMLLERAAGAQEEIGKQSEASIAEARRSGERELGRLQTDLAQQAGGTKGNSFVVGATAEGRAALESQLAALSSQLNINARNTQTTEFNNAIQGLVQSAAADTGSASAIAQLSNVLRGSKATSTTNRAATQEELETFNENLTQLVNSIVSGTQTKDTDTDSLIEDIFGIFG